MDFRDCLLVVATIVTAFATAALALDGWAQIKAEQGRCESDERVA